MGTAQRRAREKEELRGRILQTAREIIQAEGLSALSIRKIAAQIEYSPAVLYLYFKNKEAIIETMIAEDYAKLTGRLSAVQGFGENPEKAVSQSVEAYLAATFQMGEFYKSMMLSSSPAVLACTGVLHRGAAAERPAMQMLCRTLRAFPAFSACDETELEETAQVIWSVLFGLSIRMLVENLEEEQRRRLAGRTVAFLLDAFAGARLRRQRGENI